MRVSGTPCHNLWEKLTLSVSATIKGTEWIRMLFSPLHNNKTRGHLVLTLNVDGTPNYMIWGKKLCRGK